MILGLKIALWSVQILALITSIKYWKFYKNTSQRNFLYLLALIVFSEILATYIKEGTQYKNYPIYNLLSVISFLFYLFWLYTISARKKITKAFFILFVLATIISVFTESFMYSIWNISWMTGAVLVLLATTLFYSDLLKDNDILNYKNTQKFWIVTGLLIYHIGYLPMLLFSDYIGSNSMYYRIPIFILNIILYGSFIKSFLCSKAQKI